MEHLLTTWRILVIFWLLVSFVGLLASLVHHLMEHLVAIFVGLLVSDVQHLMEHLLTTPPCKINRPQPTPQSWNRSSNHESNHGFGIHPWLVEHGCTRYPKSLLKRWFIYLLLGWPSLSTSSVRPGEEQGRQFFESCWCPERHRCSCVSCKLGRLISHGGVGAKRTWCPSAEGI